MREDNKPVGSSLPASLPGRGGRPACATHDLYIPHNLTPVHALRYDWTGWPTEGTAASTALTTTLARDTAALWAKDGLTVIEAQATPEKVQILCDVMPQISPVFFCARMKGRLQHALRKNGTPVDFSRKLAFRSLGENTTQQVQGYIARQVGKERFADPRFEETMRQFTMLGDDAILREPAESNSGRYWFNLHVVLVAAGRFRTTNPGMLGLMRDAAAQVAAEKGCRIAALSVMPDHVHAALRGNIESAPEQIALAFQNRLAHVMGCRVWQDGYYAGTFSEYDLGTLREAIARRSSSPAG
jgi:REP element-mobilizing transposase RayT